jgi:hypothetical protein
MSELSFDCLVTELTKILRDQRSILLKRFETLSMKCIDYEDIVEFGNKVYANCEKAKMIPYFL